MENGDNYSLPDNPNYLLQQQPYPSKQSQLHRPPSYQIYKREQQFQKQVKRTARHQGLGDWGSEGPGSIDIEHVCLLILLIQGTDNSNQVWYHF